MKKIKHFAALVLAMCLLWAMVSTIPFAAATGEDGAAVLTQIQIDALPVKTQYWTGESLDTAGLVLLALYSDGSVQQVTEGYTLSGFHNSLTGQQTVTVTYQGKTAEFTVTVNAPAVTAIDIGQLPRKIEYWTGEALDTDGLTLTVFYSDSSVVEISEGFTVTGFDSAAAGEQTLTASYMGKTVTFAVTVKKPEVTAINIMEPPEKTNYWTGEALDTEGLVLIVSYTDGNTAQITQGYTISGFDSTQPGTQSVQVSYMGKTTAFTVTVNKLEVVGIEVFSLPAKTEYFAGESLDTTGLTLLVTYLNGSTAQITKGFTVTGYNSATVGRQTLTVWYGDLAVEFAVTVKAPYVTAISIRSMPDKTEYWIGESLDTTGLTLTATYSDGSIQVITEGFLCSALEGAAAGTVTVTVTYEEQTATFPLTVKAPYLAELAIGTLPDKISYSIGENLSTAGLTLIATYSDGSSKSVAEGYTTSGFDSSEAGTRTVTVTYEGKTATFTVTVKNITVKSIMVTVRPAKTVHWVGEELDTTGLVLTVRYSDNTTAKVTEGYTVSGFDSSTAGTKFFTITYQGKTARSYVTVKTPELTGIEITVLPAKTEYWTGEALDTTDLLVSEVYSSGKTVPVTDYIVTGFDSATAGEKTVTVTYQSYTATFNVTVNKCEHIQAEDNVCTRCGKTIAIVITDGEGNAIGNYATLSDGLEAAQVGQTLALQADVAVEDLILTDGVSLDMNGHTLTVGSLLTYASNAVIDSSEDVSGLLKITESDGNLISKDNCQLPVYDAAKGGYRFFVIDVETCAVTGGNKYWFKIKAEKFAPLYELIQSDSEVRIKVKMTWDGQEVDTYAAAELAFTKAWADCYNANEDIYITVSVPEAEGLENFRLTPGITSGGVAVFGEEME